jgi:hypothetical protein
MDASESACQHGHARAPVRCGRFVVDIDKWGGYGSNQGRDPWCGQSGEHPSPVHVTVLTRVHLSPRRTKIVPHSGRGGASNDVETKIGIGGGA